MEATPLLEARGVSKYFGSVRALDKVDLELFPGEVLALVGDNGAGKSTLIKTISGTTRFDEGEIFFEGEAIKVHGPRDVAQLGIEVVYQDLALCDNLTVTQNMFLGREATNGIGILSEALMQYKTAETMERLAVTTLASVNQNVAQLSGGQRQSLAVAKSVMWNSKVVILDEPTAALGVAQTRQVLDLIIRLAEEGLGVLVVSHNLHDLREIAHRYLVVRLGRVVGTFRSDEVTQQDIVEAITTGVIPDAPNGERIGTRSRVGQAL